MGFYIINNTQLTSPIDLVLVNCLAGLRNKMSSTIKATVESIA
jgi:hypothetical protein